MMRAGAFEVPGGVRSAELPGGRTRRHRIASNEVAHMIGRDRPSQRVASELRARIRTGEFAAGERIPPVREIAAEHDAAVSTVTRAIRYLHRQGVLVVIHRRGAYVAHGSPAAPPSAPASTCTG
jgi:GntR family transcriptional regulator